MPLYEVRVTRSVQREEWVDLEIEADDEAKAIKGAQAVVAQDGWSMFDIADDAEDMHDTYEVNGTIPDEEDEA